jgi:DNA ligase D-like protein (predicted ligase)
MLPSLVEEPPSGDKWLHEIKHDGYRTQLTLSGADRQAFTRNGHDWSERYRYVLDDARRLDCTSAVIDGEIIIQDELGRADFDNLKAAIERHPERLIFYAFDLLHLDGDDLRQEPLLDRRSRLRDLTGEHHPVSRIQFSEHVVGGGPEFFQAACAAELEGIVSKKVTSRYCSCRSKAWLKTKAFTEGEFMVIGYKREKDRSIALLAREVDQTLEYAGGAFVTLSDQERERFWRTTERLASDTPATDIAVAGASWLRPEMRVRAKHLRCSGKLRHATLRDMIS